MDINYIAADIWPPIRLLEIQARYMATKWAITLLRCPDVHQIIFLSGQPEIHPCTKS